MILTQVLPQPVPIRLAGVDYLARQLRLKDIAAIQEWIALASPCPAAQYRPIWEALDGEDRQKVAARAYLAAEHWPPEVATPDGDAVLLYQFEDGRRHGVELLLRIVLDANPGIDNELIASLATSITLSEFSELTSIAYGVDILDELAALIDLPPDERGPREATNWGKIAWDIIEATGYTFDQIGDLYLSQMKILRSGGEHARGHIPMRPGMDIASESKRRRRLFYGDDEGESTDG